MITAEEAKNNVKQYDDKMLAEGKLRLDEIIKEQSSFGGTYIVLRPQDYDYGRTNSYRYIYYNIDKFRAELEQHGFVIEETEKEITIKW